MLQAIGIRENGKDTTCVYIPDAHTFVRVPHKQVNPVEPYDIKTLPESLQKMIVKTRSDFEKNAMSFIAQTPVVGFCVVTNECNMECGFCYADKNTDTGFKFDLKWLDKLKQVLPPESFDVECTISGGEPLLDFDLVKRIRPYFKKIRIFTNGSLITDEMVEYFIAEQVTLLVNIDYVIPGFDGHSSDVTRQKVRELTAKYPELKKLIRVSVVYPDSELKNFNEHKLASATGTENDLPHFFGYVKELTTAATHCGNSCMHSSCSSLTEKDMLDELARLEAGESTPRNSYLTKHIDSIMLTMLSQDRVRVDSCGASITVNYRGDVMLCHEHASSHGPRYEDFKISSIEDFTLAKYYKSAYKHRPKVPCARECAAKWFCGGMCYANIQANRHLCDIMEKTLAYSFYIIQNYSNLDLLAALPVDRDEALELKYIDTQAPEA